jgi:hypothetical protein
MFPDKPGSIHSCVIRLMPGPVLHQASGGNGPHDKPLSGISVTGNT